MGGAFGCASLDYCHGYQAASVEDGLADELAAERRCGYLGAQTGSLALVEEGSSVDGVVVILEGYIAPDRTPKTGSVDGEDLDLAAVV